VYAHKVCSDYRRDFIGNQIYWILKQLVSQSHESPPRTDHCSQLQYSLHCCVTYANSGRSWASVLTSSQAERRLLANFFSSNCRLKTVWNIELTLGPTVSRQVSLVVKPHLRQGQIFTTARLFGFCRYEATSVAGGQFCQLQRSHSKAHAMYIYNFTCPKST
jgi:hypothetical protein